MLSEEFICLKQLKEIRLTSKVKMHFHAFLFQRKAEAAIRTEVR